tara:strand:+ start:4732 stop:5493 length:762 start_codon:yes stop_codon:yes gene_type:complete
MVYRQSDVWYFGDYSGNLPGNNYSLILNAVIVMLLAQIALSTEPLFDTIKGHIFLDSTLSFIEIFFIADYVGKLANTWSIYDYSFSGFTKGFFSKYGVIDLLIVLVLLTDFFPNDSFVVVGIYIFKSLLSIYFSSFQRVLKRIYFILTDSPAYTFFPLALLSIVTYLMAFFIYLIEKNNDAEHFGSIVRAFWFSIVTMTTIGYGDITPTTSLGKILAIVFGIVGIICVALLTANIIESNTKFNELKLTPEYDN